MSIAFAIVFIAYVIAEFKSVFQLKNVNITEKTIFANDIIKLNNNVEEYSDLFVFRFDIYWTDDP